MSDGLGTDFYRFRIACRHKFVCQCNEEHQDCTYNRSDKPCQEFTPFQVSGPVAFSTRQQDGEYIEHHDTSGIDHDLYRSEESVS